jgi:hypothetical protein
LLDLLAHAVHGADDIGARLTVQHHQHGRLVVAREAEVAQVLDRIDDLADVGELDPRAVAIRDDQILVLVRDARLIVGVELIALTVTFDGAFGAVGVRRGERGPYVFEADAVVIERCWIQLDAHRRIGRTVDVDLADARQLRQRLREDRRGQIVELRARQRVRGERENQDRRVGGIDLVIGRIAAQAGWQIGARGIDGRLHVARRAVDVAIQTELQRYARGTHRALRRHLRHVGNLSEVPFKRTRDAVGHRIGTRARQARLHGNSREVDLRQRRDRELDKREDTGERYAKRKQRGRNGAFDKGT